MRHGPLTTSRAGAVVDVTIELAPLPVVGADFIVGLLGLLAELDTDESVRVVTFRSADPDFFLMHGDVEAILAAPATYDVPLTEPNIAAVTFDRLRRAPYVSIGIIDGAARGGGCEFLSALDLRIGSERVVIGQPEAAMGILPGAGGTVRWSRLLGRAAALELLLTGRDMDATEARAVGWLHAVVATDRLAIEADLLARRIARMPRASISAIKAVVDASLGAPTDALVVESDALARLMATGAHVEPMQRFLASGGQTRAGEVSGFDRLLDEMVGGVD